MVLYGTAPGGASTPRRSEYEAGRSDSFISETGAAVIVSDIESKSLDYTVRAGQLVTSEATLANLLDFQRTCVGKTVIAHCESG